MPWSPAGDVRLLGIPGRGDLRALESEGILSRLLSLFGNGLVITDGAWGTEFQKRGLALGQSAGSLEPDAAGGRARRWPRSYVEAGSQVILTNTFRGNPVALAGHGDAEQATRDQSPGGGTFEEGGRGTRPRLRIDGPDRKGPGGRRDR